MMGLRLDFGLVLEPLGFIRILEWIFSIFAFATCEGFQGEITLLVSCKGVENETVTAAFGYPFRLNTVVFSAPDPKRCGDTWTDFYLVGNYASSAQFFVTLAVLAFLYCTAALVVYIGYMHVYQRNSKFPLTVFSLLMNIPFLYDLIVTVVAAFLWLVSTAAWAKAVTDIKMSTSGSIILEAESCKAPGTTCVLESVTRMGTLNVSVMFGLLNMVLWGGNVWFVYKDTNLHNQINKTSLSSGIYPRRI